MKTAAIYRISRKVKILCILACVIIIFAFVVCMYDTLSNTDFTLIANKITYHPAFFNLQKNFHLLCMRIQEIYETVQQKIHIIEGS